jgi:hypothetical protein
MAVLGSNRPHAQVTDMRICLLADRDRLLAELDKDIWTSEQRIILYKELNIANASLVDMQKLASKKWKRRRQNLEYNKKKRGGRPRKQYDSNGEPLYQGVPVRPKPDEIEPEDSKSKFLSQLKSNEVEKSSS